MNILKFGKLMYMLMEDTHFPRVLFLIILLKHLNGKLIADATWFLVLFYQMS
jgi:hypothetical protein